jgi:large subunit ribosomal protein L15
MNITDITTKAGASRKRKRVGRGESSGRGKTCGRGHKGAGARTGARGRSLAEGGMFPLFRRLPKFGFSNVQFRTVYQIVNVADLEDRFDDGGHVTAAALAEAGLIRERAGLVKILGNGGLKKKLTVEAHRFSASAVAKIEESSGTVKWLSPPPKKRFVKRPAKPAEAPAKKNKGSVTKGC